MNYIRRQIEKNLKQALARGKSVLLLGPRQTGKTTLIEQQIKPDIKLSFAKAATRLRYERNLVLFEQELESKIASVGSKAIIFIDEIQKIPQALDIIQNIVDEQKIRFVLTGSSARKLKHSSHVNLLPGRVVALSMPTLTYDELPNPKPTIEMLLLYGTLPNIYTEQDSQAKEIDLNSYVSTYLEEEIRAEAIVRNVGSFARFLEIAAGESGKQLNFTRISQDVGVADTTIASYYQILEDCLLVYRIDPIIKSSSKRRLLKSPKYLFFDLGIRRACANEGVRLPQQTMAHLFEHYIGTELMRTIQLQLPQAKLRYWRDSAGPEVDFILEINKQYIPIEVKWSDKPNIKDARHIEKFMQEYNCKQGYIVCRSPNKYRLNDSIRVIPWQDLEVIIKTVSD